MYTYSWSSLIGLSLSIANSPTPGCSLRHRRSLPPLACHEGIKPTQHRSNTIVNMYQRLPHHDNVIIHNMPTALRDVTAAAGYLSPAPTWRWMIVPRRRGSAPKYQTRSCSRRSRRSKGPQTTSPRRSTLQSPPEERATETRGRVIKGRLQQTRAKLRSERVILVRSFMLLNIRRMATVWPSRAGACSRVVRSGCPSPTLLSTQNLEPLSAMKQH